jgi:hypothetical protein
MKSNITKMYMLIEGYINFNSVNTQISGFKRQNILRLPLRIVKSYMNKLYGISVKKRH